MVLFERQAFKIIYFVCVVYVHMTICRSACLYV